MSYQAIARKYRPETFADVVGQEHVTGTLRAAFRKGKLSHAYVFAGPRGCGKTTVARLLAKLINCSECRDNDPCGECESCRSIAQGSFLDVLEIDAASNTGVDNIRELRDMAQYSPSKGGSRVFIIDEVHMLSKGAFNALLKILEEPPARVFFFFATTEPNKIPRTILSRCQRFDFRLLTREELSGRIETIAAAEAVTLETSAVRLLVSLAEGSLRDGLSLLDQVIAGCEEPIDEVKVIKLFGLVRSDLYLELNEAILDRDARRVLKLVDDLVAAGQNLDEFARGVVGNFRNLLVLRIDPELASAVDLPPEQMEVLSRQAASFVTEDLLALMDRAVLHFERIHRSNQPRILLEAALVEYTRFESRVLLADLARRLDDLAADATAGRTGGRTGGRSGERTGGQAGGQTGRRSGGQSARQAKQTSDGGGEVSPSAAARVAAASDRNKTAVTGTGMAGKDGAAETVPGWTALIQALMEAHPRVASCLMEGLPSLDENRGRLVVAYAADKDFQMRSLERDRKLVEQRLAETWGRPLSLVLETGTTGTQASELKESVRRQVAPTEQEALREACATDKPLSDLVELMGAEPVAETELEDGRDGDE